MSFLSSFGGVNPYQLREGTGDPEAFLNTYITDFTCQSNQFMVSLNDTSVSSGANGGVFAGDRLSNLYRVTLNGRGDSNDSSINGVGGLPLVLGKAGIGQYGGTNFENIYTNDSLANYYWRVSDNDHRLNVGAVNTNTASVTQDWTRFIVFQSGPTQELWLFKKTNTTLFIRTISNNGVMSLPVVSWNSGTDRWTAGTNTQGYINNAYFTMPEIDPTTGNIHVILQYGTTELYKLVISSSNTIQVDQLTATGWTWFSQFTNGVNYRYKLAVTGSKYGISSEVNGDGKLYRSDDSGSNWTQSDTQYWWSSCGAMNGNIYSLVSDRTIETASAYPGGKLALPVVGASTSYTVPDWSANKWNPGASMIRDNGLGNSMYVAGGTYTNADVHPNIVRYSA